MSRHFWRSGVVLAAFIALSWAYQIAPTWDLLVGALLFGSVDADVRRFVRATRRRHDDDE